MLPFPAFKLHFLLASFIRYLINRHLRLTQSSLHNRRYFFAFLGERREARSEPEGPQTRSTPILHVFPVARVRPSSLASRFSSLSWKTQKKNIIITTPVIQGCQETMGRLNKVKKRTWETFSVGEKGKAYSWVGANYISNTLRYHKYCILWWQGWSNNNTWNLSRSGCPKFSPVKRTKETLCNHSSNFTLRQNMNLGMCTALVLNLKTFPVNFPS